MKVVARHADIWHTWAKPEIFAHKSAVLDAYCGAIGRDPSTIVRANGGTVRVGSTNATPTASSDIGIQGSGERVVDALGEFAKVGVAEYIVLDNAEIPFEESLEQIGLMSDEVLPHVGGPDFGTEGS